jgi:hypothetical protein
MSMIFLASAHLYITVASNSLLAIRQWLVPFNWLLMLQLLSAHVVPCEFAFNMCAPLIKGASLLHPQQPDNSTVHLFELQAVMRGLELAPYAVASQGFLVQTSLALIAGSFMIHHCANIITAAGVGNGSTLVICMGIITGGQGQDLAQQHRWLSKLGLGAWQQHYSGCNNMPTRLSACQDIHCLEA